MWNCYGKDGDGIAIGIDKELLMSAVNKYFEKNHISAKLYKCLYKSAKQIENSQNLSSIIRKQGIDKTFWRKQEILAISDIVKHPCYRYEKEYRVVIKRGKEELVNNTIYNESKDAFFLNIPINAVKRIVVGPNANYEAIAKIFKDYFPSAKFIKSTIPYRKK